MAQLKTMTSRIPFSLNLTAEQMAALQAEAQRLERPLGYLVRQIIAEWCARGAHDTPSEGDGPHKRPS
jgi:hypothetical protein